MKKFKLLVFDWDGTLMDSESRIVSCLRASSADLELPVLSDSILRDVIGLGMKEAILKLYPNISAVMIKAYTERYREHFLSDNFSEMALFDGAEKILNMLSSEGYKLAVATGKSRQGLDRVLLSHKLCSLFHATRCADETDSKPAPRMLNEIMSELNVTPDQTLMIGDTSYDMEMAFNAKTHSLGVSYGVHEPTRFLPFNPAGCVDDVTQIYDWLNS